MAVRLVENTQLQAFEEEVQKTINEALLERGCHRTLMDIKYQAVGRKKSSANPLTDEELYYTSYSALLIFK